MTVVKDEIVDFLPKGNVNFIILGTMGSICARTVDNKKPIEPFYYHNNKNHFWRILQLLFSSNSIRNSLSVKEKKQFLEHHKIAMANIVGEIEVPTDLANDPSDDVLFRANKDGKLLFKRCNSEFSQTLKTTPIFFTCRHKKGIDLLLEGYFKANSIEQKFKNEIWHLPSPTRCNPAKRSLVWRHEMEDHLKRSLLLAAS